MRMQPQRNQINPTGTTHLGTSTSNSNKEATLALGSFHVSCAPPPTACLNFHLVPVNLIPLSQTNHKPSITTQQMQQLHQEQQALQQLLARMRNIHVNCTTRPPTACLNSHLVPVNLIPLSQMNHKPSITTQQMQQLRQEQQEQQQLLTNILKELTAINSKSYRVLKLRFGQDMLPKLKAIEHITQYQLLSELLLDKNRNQIPDESCQQQLQNQNAPLKLLQTLIKPFDTPNPDFRQYYTIRAALFDILKNLLKPPQILLFKEQGQIRILRALAPIS